MGGEYVSIAKINLSSYVLDQANGELETVSIELDSPFS